MLVERDIESWYRSFSRVFIDVYESRLWRLMAWLDPDKVGRIEHWGRTSLARCLFGANNAQEYRANAREVYKKHYASVRRLLEERGETETRLLEFDLSSGWEPLCTFLGKPVPKETPLPSGNDQSIIAEKIQIMLINAIRKRAASAVRIMSYFVMLVVLPYSLYRLLT